MCLADEGASFVCTVGRVEDRKGHILAIEAIAKAKSRVEMDIVYVVAGAAPDTDYLQEIKRAAEASGVRTVFPGATSPADLIRLFRLSLCHLLPALVMPNKVEGFGLVLVEAAAQGCPSICTRVGGVPEAMGASPASGRRASEDCAGGVVCKPGDADALADAIADYARDPEFRSLAGARALTHAQTFTWRRCAEGTYPELLKAKPTPQS